MAPSHAVHDHGLGFVSLLSGWLHHLSCPHWREIFGVYWLARRGLLPNAGLARSAGICDLAAGDFHAHSSFPSPMGTPPANCALDDPNLALRLRHRRARVPDALQMVPSRRALIVILSVDPERITRPCTITRSGETPHAKRGIRHLRNSQNLALGSDLMFHHIDAPRRMKENLW